MKALFSCRTIHTCLFLYALVIMPAFADENLLIENNETKKINITAEDKLIYDHKTRMVEFIGNVKATQGNTIITADRMMVFLKPGTSLKSNGVPEEESISKIVSVGNVTIKFNDRIATSEQAVYMTETRVLVLTGMDSKVMSGDNYITGEKITLYRADGRIVVESGTKKHVEAVLHSAKNGLK